MPSPLISRPGEYAVRWEWRLRASPEAFWPYIADTSRFNHDRGNAVLEHKRLGGDAGGITHLRMRGLEWDEQPFEWVRPLRYGVDRRIFGSPLSELRLLNELERLPDGGTRLVVTLWFTPRGWPGRLLLPLIAWQERAAFDRAIRRYDTLAARPPVRGGQAAPVPFHAAPQPVVFAPGGQARLVAARHSLLAQGTTPDLVELLGQVVEQADDIEVSRLRPYALADAWGQPRRAVLEACLQATRAGLLSLQWDVLCPLCRGAKLRGSSLGQIRADVHCESCNIDFTANFDRSVELNFRASPTIRPGIEGEFCIGGPQVTPHIVAQQRLAPGEQRQLSVALEPGRYRLRARDLPGGQLLSVTPDGAPRLTLGAQESGWPGAETALSAQPTLRLHNQTDRPQLLILERMTWSDQAVTAAEVTALQMFRDLFAAEALRPGERISVGSLTLLFTDLRDSTRLYRENGDAVAFGRVMSHFDVLRAAVMAEEGAVVKTIGDAIMAVFRRPVNGLRAVLRAEQELMAASSASFPLRLKAGLHSSPCVAVNLNDRLDYFGSTVNIASRLVDLSGAQNGVVISGAVHADPEVQAWLADNPYQVAPFQARLKGFDDESFELWSVVRRP